MLQDAPCWRRHRIQNERIAAAHVMWVSIWASATALLLPHPRQPVVRAGGISRIAPRVRASAAGGEAGAAEPEVHTGRPNPNPGPSAVTLTVTPSPNTQPEVTRLFVGGIPFDMTEADVTRLFDGLALPHEVSPVTEVCSRSAEPEPEPEPEP